MDKNTLSNYGWIVIAVLVLAVMIALATPFGKYIESGVRNTTAGLFETSEKAMNVVGMSAGDGNFEDGYQSGSSGIQAKKGLTTLTAKTWNGINSFDGKHVWTDGAKFYLNDDYILNEDTWKEKIWDGGRTSLFYGHYIWTDNTNIYFSTGAYNYVLNGNTWERKTWNIYLSKDYIWTDGVNIYASCITNDTPEHYVLKNGVWEEKTWNGFTEFLGRYVWSDGSNIYYSDGTEQYVLNGNTWEEKTWNNLTSFSADYIWSDGVKTYYSIYTSHNGLARHYVLNGNTWEEKTWTGFTDFSGNDIWTDGKNYYYSSGSKQYIFS